MSKPRHEATRFRCRDRWLDGERPWIMGVVNVTPDSFSDGGRFDEPEAARRRVAKLLEQGADVVDIGGESTRPGSEPVAAADELRRILPVVRAALELGAIVSVDTRKVEVAKAVLEEGAHLINDVGGLGDEMLEEVARANASAVAMHMQGEPRTMQRQPSYSDALAEVREFLAARASAAAAAGVPVLLDPGIGFGKRLEHNLELLAHLDELRRIAPVLLGASRKSFLAKLTQRGVEERLAGSLTVGLWATSLGVDMVRVHDVAEHVDGRAVWNALSAARARSQRAASGDDGLAVRQTPTIFVDDLELTCQIGVPEEERSHPQPVRCSIRLERALDVEAPTARLREGSDGAATVDYAEVIRVVREAAGERPRRLLETLASDLERTLAGAFPGWRATISVDKPRIADQLQAQRIGVRWSGSGGRS